MSTRNGLAARRPTARLLIILRTMNSCPPPLDLTVARLPVAGHQVLVHHTLGHRRQPPSDQVTFLQASRTGFALAWAAGSVGVSV
jgi:hypothetical protein